MSFSSNLDRALIGLGESFLADEVAGADLGYGQSTGNIMWIHCLPQSAGTTSVEATAVSNDGKMGASGGLDGLIRIWDMEDGRCIRTLPGQPDGIRSVSFTPDGRRIVSGGMGVERSTGRILNWQASKYVDCSIRVWNLESDTAEVVEKGYSGAINAVAMSYGQGPRHSFRW